MGRPQALDAIRHSLFQRRDQASLHRAQDEMQKLTDRFIKDVDAAVQAKEQELLAI